VTDPRLEITQVRSVIGRQEPQRRTLRALGLRGIHQTVTRPDEPGIRGMVAKVAHLVEVRYRGQEDPLDVEPGQEPKGVGNPPAGASVEDEDVAELREMEDEALAHEGQARGEDIVQHPVALGRTTGEITPEAFTHPLYRALWEIIAGLGGPGAGTGDAGWAQKLGAAASDPLVNRILAELAVEPIPSAKEPDAAYVLQYVVRLLELLDQRRIADVKSRLQRSDAAADPDAYNRLFAQLAALEQHRRGLRDLVAE
jgi:ribosomal protein L30